VCPSPVRSELVDINFGNNEPAPLLKFSTHVDRRQTPLPTASCSSMPARSRRIPELEEYLRSEGGRPKPKDPKNPEDQPDDQANNEGDDEPTPPRPAARTRIKTVMTVGERTLRRNPLQHEVRLPWTGTRWKTPGRTSRHPSSSSGSRRSRALTSMRSK
jgi:hypothetical protein